ncbi:MAG TPA: hypothetical protein DCR94_00975 [Firmicutes bacterium]|nr:hypothetical protein [Bacillota bacterium]
MEINEAISKYFTYLIAEKGLTKNTIDSYQEDLKFFFKSFDDIKDTSSLDESLLEEWAIYEGEKGLSPSSIARRLSSVKGFFLFLTKEGINKISINKTPFPKKKKTLPVVLTSEELSSLLNSIDINKKGGERDLAMILFMYSTGVRVSELLSLKLDDVSFSKRIVLIRSGKGSKQRSVPINELSLNTLNNYIKGERKENVGKKSPFLFLNKFGKPISRNYFFLLIKKYAKKANINKNIHPHTLRHSFATSLLENGANLIAVKEMLGHSHLETTQIYTNVSSKTIKKDYEKVFSKSKK